MTQRRDEPGIDRPAPGSHDPSTPTGSLETSSANLFEVMVAAREAQERRGGDAGRLHAFYRTLMSGTVLLPVPPDHGVEAREALASAVDEDQEVEISVMLARDAAGQPVNVLFGSIGALAAWSPQGTANLPLPARIAFANLAANGLPAILDPAGPLPYQFEAEEVAALAAGQVPQTGAPLFEPSIRSSLRLRLAGPDSVALEGRIADALRGGPVDEAYLVESEADDGVHLLLGLVGDEGASATVDVPAGTDLVWLEEPLLSSVRRVARPFYRRGRG
ncbi:MAG: SseB family protein [Chloroflexi bacterium]|nr:MAG: SseB family protein [Chloroflexota bacterium]